MSWLSRFLTVLVSSLASLGERSQPTKLAKPDQPQFRSRVSVLESRQVALNSGP
jgi:hypothetical protein